MGLPHLGKAFADTGISIDRYLAGRDPQDKLPWDFVDIGICKSFLKSEYEKSLKAESTADCRELCTLCGACDDEASTHDAPKDSLITNEQTRDLPTKEYNPQIQYRYRISYSKTGLLRFISHLDWMRMLFRRISVLDLPTVFTMGFSPHPKVSLSPPLPVGVESVAEYFDISFYEELKPEDILAEFRHTRIPDFKLYACEPISKKAMIPTSESLTIELEDEMLGQVQDSLKDFAAKDSFVIEKKTEKRQKSYELKNIIHSISLDGSRLELQKSLASPSLYDVLSALLRLPKEDLYRCRIIRRGLHSE